MKEMKTIIKNIILRDKYSRKLLFPTLWRKFSSVLAIIFLLDNILSIAKINAFEVFSSYTKFPILVELFMILLIVVLIAIYLTYKSYARNLRFKVNIKSCSSITLSVGDYIQNSKLYKASDCIFGCNNSFNLDNVKQDSLQNDFVSEYFSDKSKYQKK